MIVTTERGIQKRGTSFIVDVCVKGARHRSSVSTMDEAIVLRDRLKETGVSQRPNNLAGVWTLGKAFDETHTHVWKGSKSEVFAVRNAQKAIKFFGAETPLDEITTTWVNEWISLMLKEEHSGGSVNRKIAALSKIMTFAQKNDHLPTKLPSFNRRKEDETVVRFLTRPEETAMLALFDQWGKDDQSEAFCILVDTGLRPSELWNMQAKHLFWENPQGPVIHIPKTKNSKARAVPMTKRVQEILKRRVECAASVSTPIFPFDNYWFGRAWDRAKGLLNLNDDQWFTPYALRKTCACRLLQRGVNLKVVQEWLGHKTITVTMKYVVACPENLMDAVKVLEDA